MVITDFLFITNFYTGIVSFIRMKRVNSTVPNRPAVKGHLFKNGENIMSNVNKVLIDQDFKALRVGAFVKADENAGQFILTRDTNLKKAVLLEIAKANKIPVKNETNQKIIENLFAGIEALNLPEVDKMTETEIVAQIVADGVAKGEDDETIMYRMITEGKLSIKNTAKMFAQAMQNGGFRITNKDRKEQIFKILDEAQFKPATYDNVSEMLEHLIKNVKDTETSQAAQVMRAWAKKAQVELPKPPKKTQGGLKAKILNWICENQPTKLQDLHNAIYELSNGKKDDEKTTKRYWGFVEFGNKFVAAQNSAEKAEQTQAA